MEAKKEVVIRSIILGIVLIALGVVGIIFAGNIANVLNDIVGRVIAIIIIIVGIINIVMFVLSVTKKDGDKAKPNIKSLIFGIIAIAAGVFLVISPALIIWIISVFLGVFLLLDGGYKIKESFAANKAKAKFWYISLILGILGIALGVLAIIAPFRFATEVGKIFVISVCIALIFSGVTNIVHGALISKA